VSTFLSYIKSQISVSPELEEALSTYFKKEEIRKGEILLREDSYCRRLYFLEKGTVRTYYYHDQKDVTSWLYHERLFFTAWYSFYLQQPSFEYIETLEDCTVFSIDYHNYQTLLNQFHDFERFGRLIAEEQTAYIDYFSKGFMFLSAKDKYDALLSIFPDVELRVKLGHIATLLGISQETLSRIRSKN